MADDDKSREFNPKHRIIGAVILVTLAVIIVPMILRERSTEPAPVPLVQPADPGDSQVVVAPVEPTETTEPTAAAPADANPRTIPPIMPVRPVESGANDPGSTASAPTPAPNPPAPSTSSTTPPPPKPTPSTSTASSAPTQTKSTAAIGTVSKGWVVQLGAFSNADNAKRLEAKLREHGYTPRLDKASVDGTRTVRVRVGPYRDRDEAGNIQARIQKDVGVKGVVLSYP